MNIGWSGRGLVLMAVVLATAACGDSATGDVTTLAPDTSSTTAPAPATDGVVYEVGLPANHPNGTQLRVEQVEVFSDRTVVVAEITNGSLFGIRLDRGRTELRGDGVTAPLAAPIPVEEVSPGTDIDLVLTFEPIAADQLTLALNVGGGSSPASPSTSSPSFELTFPLDPTRTRPALPEPAALDRAAVHPNGTELQVQGVAFTANRVGVVVRATNPARGPIVLASRTIAPSLVVDDLGNRYPIMVDPDEQALTVPAGAARRGVLSFAGRIHPEASSFTLLLNQASDPATEGSGARYPRFRIDDLPLAGEDPVPLPDPVTALEAVEHPSGVVVEPAGIRFGEASISVDINVTNPGTEPVELADRVGYITDDVGNRYPLLPPDANPELVVEPGAAEATLVFSGRVSRNATEVTVVLNPGASPDDPETTTPAISVGPVALSRPPAGEPAELGSVVVAAVSRLVPDEVVASDTEQIVQTLIQFDATRTEEGVRLTLPEDILFDFGSAELREDARQSLSLIADVLDYFEGDPVKVIGHTDSIGTEEANQELSLARAEAVVEVLIADLGIDPERVTAVGRGETEPVAPNENPDGSDNPEGRQKNRRVEIIVETDRPIPGE